jgi:hypothetical protein
MLALMGRSIQILSFFLLLTLASAVRAQTPLTCGIVDVDGPSEVDLGMPLVFKAKITGMTHTTKPEFKWYLSAGTITKGQGTEEIIVDTVGLGGVVLTATVELLGAPLGCKGSESRTTHVKALALACGIAFDRYGDIKFSDEKARLDNVAVQLMNQPLSTASILMSAGKETFENETTERLARAKSYLVDVRKVDPNRIVTVDCGFSRVLTIQLYIVPLGTTLPECSNAGEVPFSEVKFTKSRPKSSKKRR